jgi:hypothetical protein
MGPIWTPFVLSLTSLNVYCGKYKICFIKKIDRKAILQAQLIQNVMQIRVFTSLQVNRQVISSSTWQEKCFRQNLVREENLAIKERAFTSAEY